VAEVKGYRREDAKDKKLAMDTRWIPGVNNLKSYGRWAFAEFGDVYTMEVDFEAKVQAEFEKMLNNLTT
jgi:type III restriction enzyme